MGAKSSKFKEGVRCLLSDPAIPHTLSHGLGLNPPYGCFNCSDQKDSSEIDFHYCCISLNVRDDETKIAISEDGKSNKCNWCAGDLNDKFYRCSLCGFCLDLSCVEKSPHPTIKNPKSHHHPLVFFPRPFPLPCDACGLVRIPEPVYTCFQCNYMVHESCINLPRLIKITRHPHRLSHIPYSPKGNSTCRICYKTRQEIFCHEHHLRLERFDVARDANKQCEACILHIDSRDFYNCTQCDFFLHEVCDNLPRKIDHALHLHPLVLKPSPSNKQEMCSTCRRCFSGFRYECSKYVCNISSGCSMHFGSRMFHSQES